MKIETATEIKRDLLDDLAICDAATEGPFHYMRSIHSESAYEVCERNFLDTIVASVIIEEDARLLTEAREGWAHAIRRAIAAEAKWAELIEIVDTNATGGKGEDINDYDIMRNIMGEVDSDATGYIEENAHLRNCTEALSKECEHLRDVLETALSQLEQADSYSGIVNEVIQTLRAEVLE